MRYLTVALTKGRLANKTMEMFEKAGYKVEKIEYSRFVNANNGSIKMYSIKKGQKLPKDFMALFIKLKNTKNNAYVSIRVDNN